MSELEETTSGSSAMEEGQVHHPSELIIAPIDSVSRLRLALSCMQLCHRCKRTFLCLFQLCLLVILLGTK